MIDDCIISDLVEVEVEVEVDLSCNPAHGMLCMPYAISQIRVFVLRIRVRNIIQLRHNAHLPLYHRTCIHSDSACMWLKYIVLLGRYSLI
jgi:hypothetical protein